MSLDFAALTDEQLGSVFQQSFADRAILDALNEELKGRRSDFACDLHISVAAALQMARRASRAESSIAPVTQPVKKTGPIREWLRNLRRDRQLERPDGRALYRYRMTDREFQQARHILGQVARSGRLEEPDLRSGALFVAYCAEWFRRESTSTFLKWDAIDPALFPQVPYPSKLKLTELGLQYWGRKLRRSQHSREFLLTLALEGGIPVRVFVDGARSWLQDYLRALLRRALAESVASADQLLEIALEERWRVSKSYDHDDFVEICAELAASVLSLRQLAEERGLAGVSNSAILNAIHADWRNELPIYVPSEDEALARELLTGLLDEKFAGHAMRGIEARRYLMLRDGAWLPALQLLADGEIAASRLKGFSPQGRVRVSPAGQLVEHVPAEIALLEPPSEGGRAWRMRPLMRTSRLIRPFALSAPVSVTLSSVGSQPVAWTWPGGEAKHSDVLVFQWEEQASGIDKLLRLVRSGSASLPAPVLHVLVPAEWLVEIGSDSAVISDVVIASLQRRLVADVDGELPLGVLRSAMREILATLGEQDDLIELSFLGDTRTPIRISRFRETMLPLEAGNIVWSGDAKPVVRMMLEPRHEYALEPLGEGQWRLPERCRGPCLVYLRDGPDVLSRPRVMSGAKPGEAPGPLAAAGLIEDYHERQSAIAEQLRSLADGPQADFSWLTDIVTNLNGLPANTIDALRLLPAHPRAALALLVKAGEADRAAIWALQDELPLLWLGLPLENWNRAMTAIGANMFTSLQPVFGNDRAAAMALDSVNQATEQLSVLEPALVEAVADAATRKRTLAMLPSLNALVSEYIKAQLDRHRDDHNDFAKALSARRIAVPQEILTKTHGVFAGLFAPVLLAASALGKLRISNEEALLIRRVLREDPAYVSAAWIHMIDFYGATGK